MLIAILYIAAPQVPPPPAPPPPMVVGSAVPRPGPPPEPAIVDFMLTEVRCRGTVERVVRAAQPLPTAAYLVDGRNAARYQLAFRIAADGRPLGISEPNRVEAPDAAYLSSEDLAPALAASRFAPGLERAGCVATYTPAVSSVASAPPAVLHRYFGLPRIGGVAWQAVVKRLRDSTPGCFKPTPPRPLLQGYPDFPTIAQPPGTLSFTMVGFDVDAAGVPINVRTLTAGDNPALDAAGVVAIERSRFAAGARTGCSYPYHRRQTEPLAPPPLPDDRAVFKKPDAICDEKVAWAKLPPLVFPEAFRRRAIEGWAVVRYDVAPWGGTGEIEIVASEPAAAFGVAARRVIAGATRPQSATGATGCIDRVRFKMADPGEESNTAPPPF